MSEIVMDEGREAVLLVGGGSLCATAVPLLLAAGLAPAGVIHGPHCDFVAEAGVPPLGRDADLARLRREFSRAVVTAPHKQSAKLRRLLHDALQGLDFALVSAVHPDTRLERDVLVGAGNLIFAGASLAAGCRTGTGCVLRAGACLDTGCCLGDHVHLGEDTHLGSGVMVEEGAHLGREVRVDAGLRLEKNIFVPDNVHLTSQNLRSYSVGGGQGNSI